MKRRQDDAAKRVVHVDPAFQPMLLGIARTKAPTALLFELERQRSRRTKDPTELYATLSCVAYDPPETTAGNSNAAIGFPGASSR